MEILWEEEGFQFGFKRWQGWAVSKVLWEWIPNVGSKWMTLGWHLGYEVKSGRLYTYHIWWINVSKSNIQFVFIFVRVMVLKVCQMFCRFWRGRFAGTLCLCRRLLCGPPHQQPLLPVAVPPLGGVLGHPRPLHGEAAAGLGDADDGAVQHAAALHLHCQVCAGLGQSHCSPPKLVGNGF